MTNAKLIGVLLGGVCLGAAVGVGATTSILKGTAGRSQAGTSTCSVDGAAGNSSALFEVDGKVFTREDLPAETQDQLFQMQSQVHDATANMVKETALRFALAKDKKIDLKSGKDLPELKSLMDLQPVSDAEMTKFFEENKGRLPPGTTFEQVKPQLAQFMAEQKIGEQIRQNVASLEEKGRFKVLLKAPVAPLVTLDLTGLPTKGSDTAKVVVVEASDYLCGHCRQAVAEVDKVMEKFSGKVRFVQANFALRPTGLSGVLTRGAWCAAKKGSDQFWKYHKVAFTVPLEAANPITPNTDKAYAETAIKVAQDAGVFEKDFETCLASEESKKAIEDANAKLTAAGVTGTPTFFVNNRKVGGVASLSDAIAAEFERVSANPSKAQ